MSFGVKGTYVAVPAQMNDAVVSNAKLGMDIAIGTKLSFLLIKPETVIQGTWGYYGSTGGQSGGGSYQNGASAAVNDEIDFLVYLAAGTYTYRQTAIGTAGSGISTVKLAGSVIGTYDLYRAGTTYNIISETTGIVVATNGLKTLNVKMATKNAASTAYRGDISICEFTRTA